MTRKTEAATRGDWNVLIGDLGGDLQNDLTAELESWQCGDTCAHICYTVDSLGRLDSDSSPSPIDRYDITTAKGEFTSDDLLLIAEWQRGHQGAFANVTDHSTGETVNVDGVEFGDDIAASVSEIQQLLDAEEPEYIAVRVDGENNATDWWEAVTDTYPEIAASLRQNDAAVVTREVWDKLAALPEFASGPEHAKTALLDLGSLGGWSDVVAGRHETFNEAR